MSRAADIIRAALASNTDRNTWLRSNDPAAELSADVIARALEGKADLVDLLDLVQSAFDAGRTVESRATALRIHKAFNAPLDATLN